MPLNETGGGQGGLSVRGLAQLAGVSHGHARAAVGKGHLPNTGLGAPEALALRVLLSCSGLAHTSDWGMTRAGAGSPETAAAQTARGRYSDIRPDSCLLATSHGARLAVDEFDAMRFAHQQALCGSVCLVLPVGRWVEEITARLAFAGGADA